jgi:hypothetical protein
MDTPTETALDALARATAPYAAERAAAQCAARADTGEHDEVVAARYSAAAARLRELAAGVARSPHALTIAYSGVPVRVDSAKIDPDKLVVPDHLQPEAGADAARLFTDALEAKALVAPPDVTIECYGDDAIDGGGFVLVAYVGGARGRGVTCGWREAKNISGENVQSALEFMAAELNAALGVHRPPAGELLTHVAIAARQPLVRAALRQIVEADPGMVVEVASGVPVTEIANVTGKFIDVLVVEAGPHDQGYTIAELDVIAEIFARTPLVVIPVPGGPTADRIDALATGALLPAGEIAGTMVCEAIANAARRHGTGAGGGQ